MNMRAARATDYWKTVFRRNYQISLCQARTEGVGSFSGIDIDIPPGIFAVAGKNGVGKSNFIRLLFNAFHKEESNRSKFKLPLVEQTEAVLLVKDGAVVSRLGEAGGADPELTGMMFDPCVLIPLVQDLISQENFSEILESFEETNASEQFLMAVNYATGNTYRAIKITNIEEEFESFPSLPFFRVETESLSYDSTSMGLGELSLFYFCWLAELLEISSVPNVKHLLFIEEPESFLPPNAQNKLANILARLVSKTGISCVLSSHSEHVLKRIPRSHIAILSRDRAGIHASPPENDSMVLRVLGLNPPKRGVLFVEDPCACVFAKELIRGSSLHVAESFSFHVCDGDSKISEVLSRLPSNFDYFGFVGVFDGDCRSREKELKISNIKNKCFLPGDVSPEELLISEADTLPLDQLSVALGVPEGLISRALDSARGVDHHDYFSEVANYMDRDLATVIESFFRLWVRLNSDVADEFSSELLDALI
ncbi:ATP-dependent nuclease [Pseudomonas sp. CAM1A]|uniref:ATP-dependent nuclease n=1 Tax=Pseudomonas sp. CAM1A TaxID=3231717 RepID=UPI0039C7127A